MTTCQYCRREYSQPPAECVGCGAPVPIAFEIPMLFDPSIISAEAMRKLQSGRGGDWIAVDPAFNAASQANFNANRMGLGSHYGYADEMLGAWLGNWRNR